MSEYDSDKNNSGGNQPWNEETGGINRTPAESDELDKLQLEKSFKTPSATIGDRLKNQPNSKHLDDGARSFWVGRKFRRRSSLITVLMLLFGTGGFLTVFFTPTLALSQMATMMTQTLNDQFHAVEERSTLLLDAKLSDVTKGSCGLVKIACRFASMSDAQAERFKKAGIEVERKEGFLLKNRGQITKMTFKGSDGKETVITSAEQLHRMSLDNIEFRAAKTKAYNPMFATLTDKVVTNILKKLKARKMPVTGETDEERQKRLNDAVGGVSDGSGRPLIETEDKDKNKTYTVGGESVNEDQANGAKSLAAQIKEVTSTGGYKTFAKNALRGLQVLGAAQTACGAYTLADVVSGVAQVEKGAQATRFAMTGVLSPESAMRAGEVSEGTFNFVANSAATPTPASDVVDESSIASGSVQTITNPNAGKTAYDSKGYKFVADHEVPESLNFQEAQFMLGGTPTTLESSLNGIAKRVSPDNPTPKGVREKCHIINNPIVTVASLGAGIILGAGSFGLTTVAGIAGSVAFSMLTPYFISQIADTLSGDTFKNLVGDGFGNGTYVGTAFFLSSVMKARGGKPLNKKEGVAYMEKNLASTAAYNETQTYIARSTPLDINNRYSFLGSIVFNMVPFVEKSKSNATAAMMSMASLIPSAINTSNPSAKAAATTLSENYFSCNDPRILSAGANGDFMCVVHYGETEKGLKIKPVENAHYMANTGNIVAESETGEPKDNGQPWNYVKFLSECVNRTTGLGVANEDDVEDGSNCTDPKKEDMNEQYRAYTMYKTINDSMDTAPQAMTTADDEAYTDGQKGTVTDGWSFPASDDAVISKAYGQGVGREKNGITITAEDQSDTVGMPVFAAYDGKVVAAGKDAELGNRIVLQHWVNGQMVSTVYAHLGDDSIITKTLGQSVKAGEQIAKVGTGDNPPRLYFEMWQGLTTTGQPVDPMGTLGVTRKAKEKINV